MATSDAGGSFVIKRTPDVCVACGTRIVLHLKEDISEYNEEKRMKDVVKTHSEFIGCPIWLYTEKPTEKEVIDDEDDEEEDEEKPLVEEVDEEETKKETKT